MAIIKGTGGADRLRGTLDADTIFGCGGGDTVSARAGGDTVDGGPGADTLDGEVGDDCLFGSDGSDRLDGGRGDDRVLGGAGDDVLGDVALVPDDGDDAYDGGGGRDTLTFAGSGVAVRLTLAEGGAAGRAVQGGEVDLVRDVEDVTGSQGGDLIFGNGAANTLDGVGGDDRLFGRGGDDVLFGGGDGASDVLLDGGAGDDAVAGGPGRVRLFGGAGADTLNAGIEFAPRAGDVDRNDLGADAARDVLNAGIGLDLGSGFSFGFGVERVANVRAQDLLNLNYSQPGDPNCSRPGDIFLTAGDFLDSDGDGAVDDADRDARLVGGDLVLDLDQLFEREGDLTADLGEQHVVLERIASVDADQFL